MQTAVKPDGQNSVISLVISKWLLPESRVLTAGQGERRLWERDCGYFRCYFKMVSFRVSRFPTAGQGERRPWGTRLRCDMNYVRSTDGQTKWKRTSLTAIRKKFQGRMASSPCPCTFFRVLCIIADFGVSRQLIVDCSGLSVYFKFVVSVNGFNL